MKVLHKFSWLALLAFGAAILFLRNADPVLNPAIYTEDGSWLGLALDQGWLYALMHVRDDYFVWGNLVLLKAAAATSDFACGKLLRCYAQSLAVFSYLFFSALATGAVLVTRNLLPNFVRAIVFILLLLLPYGDQANEIVGRASNVGYFFVFISALLLFSRDRLSGLYRATCDIGILLSIGTNPVCIPVVCICLAWRFIKTRTDGVMNFILKNKIILFGTILVVIALIYRINAFMPNPQASDSWPGNLIEVILARATLYPIVFPFYAHLSDKLSLFLMLLVLVSIGLMWRSINDCETRRLLGICLTAFIIFLIFFVLTRKSIYGALHDYQSTAPDRYFAGLNILVSFILIVAAGSAWFAPGVVKWIARSVLIGLSLIYGLSAQKLFEFDVPRYPIAGEPNLNDEICLTGLLRDHLTNRLVSLRINPQSWNILLPASYVHLSEISASCKPVWDRFFFSDEIWRKGVGKNFAGFMLPISESHILLTTPGELIQVGTGEPREVLTRTQVGDHLFITVTGKPFLHADSPSLLAEMRWPRLPIYNYTAVDLSNSGWIFGQHFDYHRGISKTSTEIALLNSIDNLNAYRIGKKIRFLNGDVREILNVRQIANYLVISLHGSQLSPEVAGFPNKLEILD